MHQKLRYCKREWLFLKQIIHTRQKNIIKDDVQMNVYALRTEKPYGKLSKKIFLFYIKGNKFVSHFIENKKLDKFQNELNENIESIFNEKFDVKPDFRKYSRCDYTSICGVKELST